MDLSESFDQPEHSDLLLTFLARGRAGEKRSRPEEEELEGHAEEQETPRTRVLKSLHVHKVVVRQSEYFKARILRYLGGSTTDSGGMAELTETLEGEEELEAATAVVRWMYTGQVPTHEGGDVSNSLLLLRTYQLADRFGLLRCVEAAAAQLRMLADAMGAAAAEHARDDGSKARDKEVSTAVFALPPAVREAVAMAPLLRLANKWLLRRFGDVPAIHRSLALLDEFCALPHAAVLSWLHADGLTVHSENCIALALCVWIRRRCSRPGEAQPAGCSAGELEQLAHGIRVKNLTGSFLHAVLPQQPWFKACSGMRHFPKLQLQQSAGAEFEGCLAREWRGPRAWVMAPRSGTAAPTPAVTLAWDMDGQELRDLYAQKWVRPKVDAQRYGNGCFFTVAAHVDGDEAAGFKLTLGVTVVPVKSLFGAKGQGALVCERGAWYDVAFTFTSEITQASGQVARQSRRTLSGYALWTANLLGPSAREAVAPFLFEGKVRLRVVVQAVR